jgi:RNA polymerase sigma-70 factor (ECF subfamily)
MTPGNNERSREFLEHLLPNQNAIRSFIYSIHPQAGDLDDIMQNTAISLWEKFETFDSSREFLPWAHRLAYFEVLRHRKKRSRDRLVFSEELVDLLAGEDSPAAQGEPLLQALEGCVSRLDTRVRAVVEARYASGHSIADLAKGSGESVHRMYRQLEKAREMLVSCVRRRLTDDGYRLPS